MRRNILVTACIIASLLCSVGCEKNSTPSSTPEPPVETSARMPDSVYKYNIAADNQDILEQITYYIYDAAGNMTLQFDSMVSNTSKNKMIMEYNAKGLMVEKREYSYYDFLPAYWSNDYCRQYEYDEADRLMTEKLYVDFTEPLASNPSKKIIYTWIDDMHVNGLVYNYAYFKPKDDPWMISERIEYTFTSQGDVEKSVSYLLWGTDSPIGGELLFTNEYTYDPNGNILSHTLYERDVLQKQEYYKYEYNEAGEIIMKWYSNNADNETDRVYTKKYMYFY